MVASCVDVAKGHDDVVLFDKAGNDDLWRASRTLAFDFLIEGFPADEMKGARVYPFDIVGKGRENRRMIPPAARFHVSLDGFFVRTH
jgi:hypothetical protein